MKSTFLTLLLSISIMVNAQTNFKATQIKFDRVNKAYKEKWALLQQELKDKKYDRNFSIIINAYKQEGKLEVWLKSDLQKTFSLFKTYNFCAHSGTLGPKILDGDGQTPEGFYYISVFNPMSNFHLSLGINYPNAVDLIRTGSGRKPGGDIYIHGNCVTIGCIPLTDDKINEVYILAVEARNSGQNKIPVNIYPFKMTNENCKKYSIQFPNQLSFWKTLQPAYLSFEKNKTLPNITQVKGNYILR
ncbi:hypothetical protein EZJ43_15110 [Pedobacter changchengzhani]|uniref:L,D-TPase catalytic domain-containing protein n=1 Tax=Pedobacter changchengzhani TaxID=2529274 RepID=A0A4V2ZZX9_9SPHI|nr:L,D-transpeptidase family protein [Pedobacter changchengzhani]TDG35053.1 hypothetical protein EZJ43_15110 [Pedobacter changchengzhani]